MFEIAQKNKQDSESLKHLQSLQVKSNLMKYNQAYQTANAEVFSQIRSKKADQQLRKSEHKNVLQESIKARKEAENVRKSKERDEFWQDLHIQEQRSEKR